MRPSEGSGGVRQQGKSEFLARMSHEIRTPLNGVVGMIDALQAGGLNEIQRRYAKIACDSVGALTTVINDILDFSKIEAGKVEIESVEFDPHDLLESLIELFSSSARPKRAALVAASATMSRGAAWAIPTASDRS